MGFDESGKRKFNLSKTALLFACQAVSFDNTCNSFPLDYLQKYAHGNLFLRKSKLAKQETQRRYVIEKIKNEWSPKEISERIRIEYPLDTAMQNSHVAIYQFIYVLPRGELRQMLTTAPRRESKHHRTRKTGNGEENRGKIANMVSIEAHPAEVADRTGPAHWGGDLTLEIHKRSVPGTLVERTTRYTILVPLGNKKDALSVREAYGEAFKGVPDELKKT